MDSCRLVLLGSQPVHALLAVEDGVWASCGHHVSVIQGESLHTQVCMQERLQSLLLRRSVCQVS